MLLLSSAPLEFRQVPTSGREWWRADAAGDDPPRVSATATAAYYAQYLTAAPGEVPGVWSGRQAAGLGLSGRVEVEALEALLSGRDPTTGTRLGRELLDRYTTDGRGVRAVSGFDATFSAPKSLSVWWALTGDLRLLDAHDVAVSAALTHLERFGSTTRIRSNGGRLHPDTNGLTIATFRQTTSRADDPQLHTHAVSPPRSRPPKAAGRVGCPLPEEASADARRPVPVGAASRAHPPIRCRLATDRQRSDRDRRHPRRAPRHVLQAHRRHRRRTRRQA